MGTKRPANQMGGALPYGNPPAPAAHTHHHHQHSHHAAVEASKRQRMDLVEMPASAFAKIQVTSAQAGIVIGQKGSTIQQIRLLSGARVNIDSHDEAQAKTDPSKRDVREMTCVGTIEQVEAALNLLRQCFQTDNLIASAGKGGGSGAPRGPPQQTQPPPPMAARPQHVPPPSPLVPPPHGSPNGAAYHRPY